MAYKYHTASQLNREQFKELLTPSWLSGLIAIIAGLVISVGVIAVFSFHNSQIERQLVAYQSTIPQATLTTPYQTINPVPETVKNTWPLIVFWAAIGLVAYFVVDALVKLMAGIRDFRKELNYVHTDKHSLAVTTIEYLTLRLLAVLAWFLFARYFFKTVLPRCILLSHEAAANILLMKNFGDALLAFLIVVLSLHLLTILLRLAFRRTRLFYA